jgi:hypothetical protein
MPPMERLLKLGESGFMADVTAKVRRAKAIAKHYKQWSSKAPNGNIIMDGSLSQAELLELVLARSTPHRLQR